MKCLVYISLMSTFLLSALNLELRAQNDSDVLKNVISSRGGIDETSDRDSVDTDLILGPVMTSVWEYRYARDEPERFTQSGMFASMYGFGAEYTFSPADSRFYGNLFVSWIVESDQRIENSRFILWNGLTVGLETFLHTPPDYSSGDFGDFNASGTGIDGTQFYTRIGPGIGMMNVARVEGQSFETHPGIHTAASLGGFRNVGRWGTLYIEMSGLVGYFPTLNEMNLIGTPKLSVGFMFIRGQRIPVNRY